MKSLVFLFLLICGRDYAQNRSVSPSNFKGEDYALYTKCFSAITFCEITQQSYTSCGSVKNCYGLYVLPGDTFYVNIEDKNQSEVISADISFGGYFPMTSHFIFKPIDNNCVPQQALQVAIPLNAVPGSSFQIVSQNIAYVNSTLLPGTPFPFDIYVGGQQMQYTFALSDFTVCPIIQQVSVVEITVSAETISMSPNPSIGKVKIDIENYQKPISYKLLNSEGIILRLGNLDFNENELLFEDLRAGIYFISFYREERIIEIKKLALTNSGD